LNKGDDIMTVKNDIKSIIVQSGWTMSAIIEALNQKYDRTDTIQNLSNKLTRGTLRYSEAQEIAEIIGFEIKWVKR
jgi:hypothetical protein